MSLSFVIHKQVLGTYDEKEECTIAYATQVEHLGKKLLNFEIVQIPQEGNVETDKLARMASFVEGTWLG